MQNQRETIEHNSINTAEGGLQPTNDTNKHNSKLYNHLNNKQRQYQTIKEQDRQQQTTCLTYFKNSRSQQPISTEQQHNTEQNEQQTQ